jgi:hypothetical protein
MCIRATSKRTASVTCGAAGSAVVDDVAVSTDVKDALVDLVIAATENWAAATGWCR